MILPALLLLGVALFAIGAAVAMMRRARDPMGFFERYAHRTGFDFRKATVDPDKFARQFASRSRISAALLGLVGLCLLVFSTVAIVQPSPQQRQQQRDEAMRQALEQTHADLQEIIRREQQAPFRSNQGAASRPEPR